MTAALVRTLGACAVVALLVAAPGAGAAQGARWEEPAGEPDDTRADDTDADDTDADDTDADDGLSDEARAAARADARLRADGWEFREARATTGNAAAGTLAIVLGPLWHGAGHALAGDRQTANRLFISEGIGLVAMGAGLAVSRVGSGSQVGRDTGATLQVLGGSVLAAGWLADVVGAFKGTADSLPTETSELPGLTIEAYYTALVERGVDLNSVFVVRAPIVAPRWVLRPEVQAGVDTEYVRAGLRAGWRVPVGGTGRSFLELGAVGFDESMGAYGFGRTSLAGGLQLTYDLGDAFSHLGGLLWTNRVEVAVDHLYFEHTGNRRFAREGRSVHVPVEMGLGFNANQGVHLGFGYRHRRDELVGMMGRRAGVMWGRLGLLPRNRIGVDLQVEQGAFTRAWVGLQWTLVPGERFSRARDGDAAN